MKKQLTSPIEANIAKQSITNTETSEHSKTRVSLSRGARDVVVRRSKRFFDLIAAKAYFEREQSLPTDDVLGAGRESKHHAHEIRVEPCNQDMSPRDSTYSSAMLRNRSGISQRLCSATSVAVRKTTKQRRGTNKIPKTWYRK